jgi:hypothetical protein
MSFKAKDLHFGTMKIRFDGVSATDNMQIMDSLHSCVGCGES